MPKFAPITLFPLMLRGCPRHWNTLWSALWSAFCNNRARRSGRIDAGIGFEAGRRNAGERALFVIVRRIARDADRPDDVAGSIPDQDAAGHRHEAPVARGRER